MFNAGDKVKVVWLEDVCGESLMATYVGQTGTVVSATAVGTYTVEMWDGRTIEVWADEVAHV